MMFKCTKILLFLLIISLFASSVSALGVWDSDGTTHVFEGQNVILGTNIIRITQIENHEVSFTIEKFGKFIGEGTISESHPSFALEEEVWIEYKRPSDYYRYGKGAYIELFAWVDGKIVNHNIPVHMHVSGFYDMFVNIKNLGSKTARFRVELTQEGVWERSRYMFRLPSGEYVPRLLDIDYPSQLVTLSYDSTGTVEYNEVKPNSGSAKLSQSIERTADMVLNLYYGEVLLDQIKLGRLTVDTTRSGYIKKISAPSVMMRDMEYLIDIEVVNTGYTAQGISKTFNLELMSPDFKMSPVILRDEIPSFASQIWRVRIRPTKIGEQEIKFRLFYNKGFAFQNYKTLHELSLPVKVVSGYSTYIEKITIPDGIKLGDTFEVGVNLHNYGNERMINVRLRAPELLEVPLEKMIKLSPTTTQYATFKLTANAVGKLPIIVEILPTQEVITPGKNYDPYVKESYVINAKSVYVDVTSDKVVEVKEVKDPVLVQFVDPPTPQIITPVIEDKEPEVKSVKINVVTTLLLVAVVVLSLVLLKVILSLKKKK